MTEPNADYQGLTLPRRTLQKLTEHASGVLNPLDLPPARVATLLDLAEAEIDVIGGAHLIQEQTPCLIRREHGLPHTKIYVPLRGGVEWRSGSRSWTVRPGQFIISGAGQPEEAYSLEDYFEVITLNVHIRLTGATPDQPLFDEQMQALPGDVAFWHEKLETVWTFCSYRQFAEMNANIIRLLLVELTLRGAELLPHRRATDPRVRRAMELIQQQVGNPRVLHAACRGAQVSASHLRLLFRKQLGMSPRAYHHDLRLRAVQRLLTQPELSIDQIADRLGYANQQHLEKDFKKHTGMAPGKYRKKL